MTEIDIAMSSIVAGGVTGVAVRHVVIAALRAIMPITLVIGNFTLQIGNGDKSEQDRAIS